MSKIDLGLHPVDDLFTTEEMRKDEKKERVEDITLTEITEFPDHPFHVFKDDELMKIAQSIKDNGVLLPAVARLKDNKYQLISGHRRKAACEILGLETMPVLVRNMTDDEAVIAMVDSNLHREHILPSEKAFAYRMKRDALTHQGRTSPQLGEKLLTVEFVGAETGDSKNQVLRYIRLTNLVPPLLQMVDDGKIAFNPAVELSYLTQEEQLQLLDVMEYFDCTPSHAQSIKLKKLSQDGQLNAKIIEDILGEEKPNQQEHIKLRRDDFREYFPAGYSEEQMKKDILHGLELLKRQCDRDRDSR